MPSSLPLLLRSVLYVPGSNARALAKVASLSADAFILDLEDAVAPASKAAARSSVTSVLRGWAAGSARPLTAVVRVNRASTPWGEADLVAIGEVAAACGSAGPHAVLLPKVESVSELEAARRTLASVGASSLPLWAMIETPLGVLRCGDVATGGSASSGLTCLVAGTSDLTADLHARHVRGRAPLLGSLSSIVLAARAAGCSALDGVHLSLGGDNDAAALQEVCDQGRDMGFDGKTIVHPSHIAAANAAWSPTLGECAAARAVCEAYAAALQRGDGVAVVDGRLVEALHVRAAQQTLARAEAISSRQ